VGGARGCTSATGWRGSAGRKGRAGCASKGRWWAMYDSVCVGGERGGDVERSARYLGVTRLYSPSPNPFTLTLRAPHPCVRATVFICVYILCVYSPAALASLHSRYMSDFISGLSSAMVSPTVTNRSMAKFTPWPTLAIALAVLSVQNGRSRCATNVDICNGQQNILLIIVSYLLLHKHISYINLYMCH